MGVKHGHFCFAVTNRISLASLFPLNWGPSSSPPWQQPHNRPRKHCEEPERNDAHKTLRVSAEVPQQAWEDWTWILGPQGLGPFALPGEKVLSVQSPDTPRFQDGRGGLSPAGWCVTASWAAKVVGQRQEGPRLQEGPCLCCLWGCWYCAAPRGPGLLQREGCTVRTLHVLCTSCDHEFTS